MSKPEWVLVHGGSHGAWCWEPLRAELAILGFRSHALDLPGHGEDLTPRLEVTWETQVNALDAFLESLERRNLVLVGHSLAGVLLPEVAARNTQAISQVVFLAAIILEPGENAFDTMDTQKRAAFLAQAETSPENSIFLNYETARRNFFGELSEADAQKFYRRTTPQPVDLYSHRAKVAARDLLLPLRYIGFGRDSAITPTRAKEFARRAGVPIEMMDAGHDAILSHPVALANLLAAGLP